MLIYGRVLPYIHNNVICICATTCKEDGHKQTTKTGAQNVIKEIKRYQEKWLQRVQRMDTDYQNRSTERNKGNKTVPGKVATTCTEDGHKQTTKTGAQNILKEIKQYQEKVAANRLPKQALQYKPKG